MEDKKYGYHVEFGMETMDNIFAWVSKRDIGVSSNTILYAISGKSVCGDSRDIPYDGSDFSRCLGLLNSVPELKPHLQKVAEAYPAWTPIIREWDNLVSAYRDPKVDFYAMLHSLRDECMECDGYVKEGNIWKKKEKAA